MQYSDSMLRLTRVVRAGVAIGWAPAFIICGAAVAQAQRGAVDNVAAEASYALTIARVADSAIHRLDFFPARTQVRIQMAFLSPGESNKVPFGTIHQRGTDAALIVDAMLQSLVGVAAPEDLVTLHKALLASLRDATHALNELSAAAAACDAAPISVQRCQVPFTSASSAVSEAYTHYLEARSKIAMQITDTGTRLAEFNRPPAS